MSIKIANSKIVPELNYENIHLLNFHIEQKQDQINHIFKVSYEYIMYSLTADGTRIFDESSKTSDVIDDFVIEANSKKEKGDNTFFDGMNYIEQAIAILIEARQNTGTSTVTPY